MTRRARAATWVAALVALAALAAAALALTTSGRWRMFADNSYQLYLINDTGAAVTVDIGISRQVHRHADAGERIFIDDVSDESVTFPVRVRDANGTRCVPTPFYRDLGTYPPKVVTVYASRMSPAACPLA